VFPTVEIRICDAQPELGEARAITALCYALTARIARALDEGEPLPSHPNRLLEENLWRALRWGLSGELIDFDLGESIPARARLEQLLEWVRPTADELGVSAWLSVPERNAAERQIARHAEGATMEQIFVEQVAAGERIAG
jgi:carboxylate-amine ligase